MKNITIFIVYIFIIGCATTHPGKKGNVLSGNIENQVIVSGKSIDGSKSESYQLIEVTIENLSDEWLKIKTGNVIVNDQEQTTISLIQGDDLKYWGKAMAHKLKIEVHNKNMAMTGLLIASDAASKSSDENLKTLGQIGLIGTMSWAVTDVLTAVYKNAITTDQFPEEHLNSPVSIPGKMFTRRWILFNKPSKSLIQKLVFSLETIEGEKSQYEVSL